MTNVKNNTGVANSGNRNSGNWNSGNWNSGNRNSGNRNSGNWNSGNRNSGNWNSGNRNSGNLNSGNRNSGNWNSGNLNSGDFNTETNRTLFNKPCTDEEYNNWEKPSFLYFDVVEYIYSENMTEREEEDNPSHKTTGGYNKVVEYKEAFQNSWNKADKEDRVKIKNAPNFDADIFFEISGIRINEEADKKEQQKAEILAQIEELKKKAEAL